MTIIIYFFLKVSGGAGGYSHSIIVLPPPPPSPSHSPSHSHSHSDSHSHSHSSLYSIPYNIYPHPSAKYGARIFYVDSAADVLKCAKIITRFFRTFHFGSENFVRRYT